MLATTSLQLTPATTSSLRLTGSALCTFAAGESLSVSDQTPAVFLHPPNPHPPPTPSKSSFATATPIPPRVPLSPSPSLYPPPPPPPLSPSIAPSPTITSSKLPHILSASTVSSTPRNRCRKPPRLPHILSQSSLSPSSSPPRNQKSQPFGYPTAYQANSSYSDTQSQASSVWNWENFCPTSPPESEFFNQKKSNNQRPNHLFHIDYEEYGTETETKTEAERSEWIMGFFGCCGGDGGSTWVVVFVVGGGGGGGGIVVMVVPGEGGFRGGGGVVLFVFNFF
ncbi:hypothetical protein Tsubulata_050092 [Turnera subulata]|uniref:Uncharacterized protein n=1 Tax=Turnera subulata TaxID=218843 RepID=A0A9Q0JC53_9ROSI|nr:hypothetical protein Tsubulata_050092 [Turnera subulata]